MSLKSWLKTWNSFLFKIKISRADPLPESPKQEIQSSSNQSDVVLQSLDVKDKQEQSQWFQKKNDLREAVFELNPVWNNHNVYGTADAPGDDFYRFKTKEERDEYIKTFEEEDARISAEIIAIEDNNDTPLDEVKDYTNPWKDKENFPVKNYPLTPQEAIQLQPKEKIGNRDFDAPAHPSWLDND